MTAHVRQHNGTPTLFLDDEPAFGSYLWAPSPGREEFAAATTARAFAEVGIHLYAFDVGTSGTVVEWCGPGEGHEGHYDFRGLAERFGRVLDADPEARFHLRVHLRQREWWRQLYPDQWEVPSEPVEPGPLAQSFASPVWREQAKEFLRAYAAAMNEAGLGERVFAWQVGAGNTSEWVKGDISMCAVCGDYSAPMTAHFRDWLRRRYGDREALREAWGDGGVDFDGVVVPPADEQRRTHDHSFRDPRREMHVIDYYRSLADLCGDLVVDFCRAAKEGAGRPVLAGAFYGYLLELAWNKSFFGVGTQSEWSTVQRSGHLGLRRVLRSDAVDFIVSPYSYGFRGIGGEGVAMPPQDSLRLHDTLYVFEEDTRVHLAEDTGFGRVYDLEGSVSVLTRNFAQIVTRGQAAWWLHTIDPSKDPGLAPLMARFQEVGTWALNLDRSPSAEVAVIVDDESFFYESIRNDLDLPLIFQQRLWGLPRMGAPFDTYLLEDLCEGRLPDYRLYIFLNPLRLDRERRAALATQLRRDGKVALWIYGAGYIAGEEPGVEHMQDLTGIRFATEDHPWGPMVHILDFEHEITRDLTQDLFWGTNANLGPLFYADDEEVRTLGQAVLSLGRCVPGFVVKELPGWTSIWSAAPNLPANVLRGIARFAGVHLYCDAGDVLHASRDLLGLHTVSGGRRTIRLPRRADVVYDLMGRAEVARDAETFDIDLAPRSSTLLFAGEAAAVAGLARGDREARR